MKAMSNKNNASDRELLELVVAQVSKLTMEVSGIKSDMTGMKTDMTGMKTDMTGMKTDISGMKTDMQEGFNQVYADMQKGFNQVNERIDKVEKTVLKIEQEHGEKLSALFDGYKQNSEKLECLDEKVDKLQMDVNSLNIKAAYNDSRILELSRKIR
jgi:DNA anti-recombination protein RmuC